MRADGFFLVQGYVPVSEHSIQQSWVSKMKETKEEGMREGGRDEGRKEKKTWREREDTEVERERGREEKK